MAYGDKDKRQPKEEMQIAFIDMDMSYYKSEVKRLIELWNAQTPLETIQKDLQMDYSRLAILILWLIEKGRIKPNGKYVIQL